MLTRDQILSIVTQPKKVTVPHLGEVYLRLLSEAEAGQASGQSRVTFVCMVLCDAEGKRIFSEADQKAVEKSLPFATMGSIFEQGLEFNDMQPAEDDEPAKN